VCGVGVFLLFYGVNFLFVLVYVGFYGGLDCVWFDAC